MEDALSYAVVGKEQGKRERAKSEYSAEKRLNGKAHFSRSAVKSHKMNGDKASGKYCRKQYGEIGKHALIHLRRVNRSVLDAVLLPYLLLCVFYTFVDRLFGGFFGLSFSCLFGGVRYFLVSSAVVVFGTRHNDFFSLSCEYV